MRRTLEKPSPSEVENLIDWVEDGHTTIVAGAQKPGRLSAAKSKADEKREPAV
jgi:hypothetical protein